jgi:hypothetical protein
MNTKHLYLTAFLLSIAGITFFSLKDCKELPWPPRIIATAIVFALIDIMSFFTEELAGVTAIGIVIAIYVQKGFAQGGCQHNQATGTGQVQLASTAGISAAGQQPPQYNIFANAQPGQTTQQTGGVFV